MESPNTISIKKPIQNKRFDNRFNFKNIVTNNILKNYKAFNIRGQELKKGTISNPLNSFLLILNKENN